MSLPEPMLDWEEHVRTFVRGRAILGRYTPRPRAWERTTGGFWRSTETCCSRCGGKLPMEILLGNLDARIPACDECADEVHTIEHDMLAVLRTTG